jgi:hypothetical protein
MWQEFSIALYNEDTVAKFLTTILIRILE